MTWFGTCSLFILLGWCREGSASTGPLGPHRLRAAAGRGDAARDPETEIPFHAHPFRGRPRLARPTHRRLLRRRGLVVHQIRDRYRFFENSFLELGWRWRPCAAKRRCGPWWRTSTAPSTSCGATSTRRCPRWRRASRPTPSPSTRTTSTRAASAPSPAAAPTLRSGRPRVFLLEPTRVPI